MLRLVLLKRTGGWSSFIVATAVTWACFKSGCAQSSMHCEKEHAFRSVSSYPSIRSERHNRRTDFLYGSQTYRSISHSQRQRAPVRSDCSSACCSRMPGSRSHHASDPVLPEQPLASADTFCPSDDSHIVGQRQDNHYDDRQHADETRDAAPELLICYSSPCIVTLNPRSLTLM